MSSTTNTTAVPVTANEKDFDALVLQSDVPVLVDFWAGWCAPCRAVAPELEQLAAELGDTARVVKVDIDENPQLVERFGISSIPTLAFFRGGQEVDRVVGALPRSELSARLAELR